jgi:hypothetical protein
MKTSTKRASKLIVEITTQELFRNYGSSTLDVLWDHDRPDFEEILSDPLQSIYREDADAIRRLFKDGFTMMLLGNAFSELDKHDVVEVIVTVRGGGTFTVANDDVQY